MIKQATKSAFFLSIILLSPIMLIACTCGGDSSNKKNIVGLTPASGPLMVHSSNPRYFQDASGRAIYLTGVHNWSNLVEEPSTNPSHTFDYPKYLNLLNMYNHNFIRLWAFTVPKMLDKGTERVTYAPFPWQRKGPGLAADGLLKFDLSEFDHTYFERLRSRVIDARERGIYVSIMLFEGWCLAGQEAGKDRDCWTWHPFNITNNVNNIDADADGDGKGYEFYSLSAPASVLKKQKEYIQKVVDTVNDLDNVLYEIVNEASPLSVSWQYHMINYLKDYQGTKSKQHPVGMTAPYFSISNSDLLNSPADWISPVQISQCEDYRYNPPAATGQKVMILDTDHLWGIGGDRSWVWKSLTRGLNPIYMDRLDSDDTRVDARKAMGHTLVYAQKIGLDTMIPYNELSSTTFCLADPGSKYLIYQPEYKKPFTVNLLAGTYNFEWFDPISPISGKIVLTGEFEVLNEAKVFYPPFNQDSVLYIYIRHRAI